MTRRTAIRRNTDALSEVSRAFLAGIVARELPVALREIAQLEIACTLARRLRDAEQGRGLAERILGSPLVTTYSLNRARLREAMRIGTGGCLRSGDALYAALAEGMEGEVVSWDRELIERGGALTPREWVDARSSGTSPGRFSGSPWVFVRVSPSHVLRDDKPGPPHSTPRSLVLCFPVFVRGSRNRALRRPVILFSTHPAASSA